MTSTIEIFLCYAREDEGHRRRLEKQLRVFQREELIRVWHDCNISPGEEWEQQVHDHLNTAQIVLLLLSPDFMDSDYCYGIEMTEALKRHAEGEARVVPIIVRPVHWDGGPLKKLQALPTDGKPITSAFWHNLDDAFHDVAEGVRKVIGEFLCIRWLKKGNEYFQDQQMEEAFAAFTKAINFAPYNEAAYQIQGDAFYCLGRYQDALSSYEHVHSPESSILLKQGQCLLRLQRYEDNLAVCDKLLRLSNHDALAHAHRGYALFLLKRYDEALIACKQADRLDPKSALIHYFTCLVKISLKQRGIMLVERIGLFDNYDAITYLAKGDVLFNLGRYDEALAAYANAQQLAPNDPWIYEHQGGALQRQGQYDEALSAYEKAIQLDSNNADLYHKKALVLEQLTQQAHATARERGYTYDNLINSEEYPVLSQTLPSLETLATFSLVHELEGHPFTPQSVAISPNRQFVAATNSSHISVWDLQKGVQISASPFHSDYTEIKGTYFTSFLAFNPDSSVIIAGSLGSKFGVCFTLWNPYTTAYLGTLEHSWYNNGGGEAGAFSPNKEVFVGAYSFTTPFDALGYTKEYRISAWSLNNRASILGKSENIYNTNISIQQSISPALWSMEMSSAKEGYIGHYLGTTCLIFSSDGQTLASGGTQGDIRIWNAHTMRSSCTITGHRGSIRCLIFASDGRTLISGSDDKTIKVWNLHSGKLLRTLQGHSEPIRAFAISPDGRTLLSIGSDPTAYLWDLHQGVLIRRIELPPKEQPDTILTAIVTFDRKLLIGSINDKKIKIWENK